MSEKNNSEAVIGQFKSLICKRTNMSSTSVTKVCPCSQPQNFLSLLEKFIVMFPSNEQET